MKKLYPLLCSLLLMFACDDTSKEIIGPTPQPTPSITLPSNTPNPVVSQSGGVSSYAFTATDEWSIETSESKAPSWLEVTPTSGGAGAVTLTLRTQPNETYDQRNAAVKIRCGSVSKTFTVSQKQKDALTVTTSKFEVDAEGGTLDIETKSNVSYTFEIAGSSSAWISQEGSKALVTQHNTFRIAANLATTPREGSIVVRSGVLSETIKVYQKGSLPSLVVTTRKTAVAAEGGTIKVELTSNTEYSVTMPSVDWIAEDRTAENQSSYTHYYTIAPNKTYDAREAVIVFRSKTGSLRDSVIVTQMQQNALIVARNAYELDREAHLLDFTVQANVELSVATDVEWIRQVASKGLVDTELHFSIALNEGSDTRTGKITIQGGGETQVITLTQTGQTEAQHAQERAALLALYKATGGDQWLIHTHWCSEKPVGEWYGVQTDAQGFVVSLWLDGGNRMEGMLPEELGLLSHLETLNLSRNPKLTGTIPFSLGSVTSLKYLSLIHNALTGAIPASLGALSNLQDLNLSENQLSGEIPIALTQLQKLQSLNLSGNQLGGSIPSQVGRLTQLKKLNLWGNKLTGEIPASIAAMTALQTLWVAGNQLTGTFPSKFGAALEVSQLCFQYNQMTGTLPKELTSCEGWQSSGWRNICQQGKGFDRTTWALYLPNITATDANGKMVNSLEVAAGSEYTFLWMWSAEMESHQELYQGIAEVYRNYHTKGLGMIGFCDNGEEKREAALALIQSYHMEWPTILQSAAPMLSTNPSAVLFDREGRLIFSTDGEGNGDLLSVAAKLQELLGDPDPNALYTSVDYSADGKYATLQKATQGNGLDLVLMGDGYSDRLIEDGTYEKMMREGVESFFEVEPYRSFRNYFNVYYVKVVSPNEEFSEKASTALSCEFGEGTYIGGDNTKCLNYASHIEGMSDARMNNVGVIVILNSARHSGTCHMYYGIPGDYAVGPSVSYFSCGTSPEQTAELLHHEAGGHGFAKLADEYQYDAPIPQEQITYYQTIYANYGLYKNVDFTTDPKTVKWSRFLSDSRYAAEELGIYEGACTYATGAYRPTENSIMRYGTGEFNAPSREAIYYRLFKLANGATWKYDYEAFVKWDQTRQRPTQSKAAALLQQPLSTTPPVLYKGYWRNGALRLE